MQSSYVRHRRKTTRTAYKTTANARLRRHASFHEEIAFDRTRYTMNVAAPMIAEERPGRMMFLKIAAPFAFIPMAIVIILDGGLGLLKLSFRRFLKIKNFMEGIRTPLHDHARKNKGWSDTQVVIRFTILQIIVNLCFMAFVL